jgi:preprotein translocase subunit SecF
MIEFFKKTEIDFVGRRMTFFVLSGIMVLVGLLALVRIGQGEGRLGIDFVGGAVVALKFEAPVEIQAARAVLERGGIQGADLQEMVGGNRLLIRFKEQKIKNIGDQIQALFAKEFPKNPVSIESSAQIGPTIGQKLRSDALLAITLSMIGIILYIAIRFEFQFGIAAAIATLHDVLVVLGVMFLLNKEITLLVVTALLTLAGYSLSDTVVVFDRIRENLRFRKKESFPEIINKSINDVLARTFNTSVTAFSAVFALFLFGGAVLHDFALAMLLGILVGTYSSWFIASPLLLLRSQEVKLLKKA